MTQDIEREALERIAFHEPQYDEVAEAMRQIARQALGSDASRPSLPAAELDRVRDLVGVALDALDAEKTPDFGVGHDRAVAALSEALTGTKPIDPYVGRMVPLNELRESQGGEQ